jgi:hypothetical protein
MHTIANGKTVSMSRKGPAVYSCLWNPQGPCIYFYSRDERMDIFLGGRRYVSALRQRTRKDWAREVRSIVRGRYPLAEQAVLVMDNLNTHTISSLYDTFPAAEAFGIAHKLELHYTPKHGSWLNMAEIELSAMTSQCLDRRIDTLEKLAAELDAWQLDRNARGNLVRWQFTTEDARIKLHGLYPNF